MRVIVVGGSNSLLQGGWVTQLAQAMPEASVLNLSIGAATSMMGFCRLAGLADLQAGDVVIWEYALNDVKQIERGLTTPDACLRYVELTLLQAARAGAAVLPLVMAPSDLAPPEDFSLYRLGLADLFRRYGVRSLEVNALYCQTTGAKAVPQAEYQGIRHYRTETAILPMAVAALQARLAEGVAAVQPPATPCLGLGLNDVALVSDFGDTPHLPFANSLMQLRLHQPPATPTALLTPPPGQWRLAAALVLQSRSAGQFRLMTGKAEVSISLLNKSKTFDKPRLGMQIIPAGQRMRIGPRNPLSWVGADPSALPPDAPTSGLVSLLLERNQGREAAFDAMADDD